ncbi:unnamed protein product [Phytomonas sp. Hart1]|nr:unnamed protein product [Phytomonas sp. Hart1]|eukprot:CCW71591.1 unnamed protein product [Phytomonas sp. isolate Hart1]
MLLAPPLRFLLAATLTQAGVARHDLDPPRWRRRLQDMGQAVGLLPQPPPQSRRVSSLRSAVLPPSGAQPVPLRGRIVALTGLKF